MEHFRFIKDQKIDLSDPNPQLALEPLVESIQDVWAARFGGFPAHSQPRKGALYDKGKSLANQQPKQKDRKRHV